MKDHKRVTADTEGASMTQANFAKDTNINTIVSRHMRGPGRSLQNIGQGGHRQPMFGDFSEIDYHAMLNQVTQIDNMFRTLPAKVRGRFQNRPELLLNFLADPNNDKEAVKLGLKEPPPGSHKTPEGELKKDPAPEAPAAGTPSNTPNKEVK